MHDSNMGSVGPQRSNKVLLPAFLLLLGAMSVQPMLADGVGPASETVVSPAPSATAPAPADAYLLGPGDQVTVLEPDLDELNGKLFRVDLKGDLDLPLAGRFSASQMTIEQVEQQIEQRVRKYVEQPPHVVVNIVEYHSQPVSILGAVGSPGIHQLEGNKTLYEVLSLAGGLRPEAGNTVVVTRQMRWGPIPLPNAKVDGSGKYSVASVTVNSVLSGKDPTQNIIIRPDDVISVSRGDVVYAVGSVNKPGGFPIGQADSLSVLQVLSLAQGMQKTAAANKAKILRNVPNSERREEIAVNLKQLMAGKGEDIKLQPDDILFVPNSGAKSATARSIDALVAVATGVAIYAR